MSDKSVKLANNFLQNAPPGEFEQCSAALSTIVSNSSIVQQSRKESSLLWHEKNYYFVIIHDHPAIVCKEARQSDGSYLDPHTGLLFQFNFDSKEATPLSTKGPQSPLCAELQPALDKYLLNSYKEKAACGCYPYSDGSVSVVLRAASLSLQNYRTGSVYATYNLAKDGTFKGRIEATQHFFENGNALGQFGSNLNAKISMGDPKSIAKDVIRTIDEFELKWLDAASTALDKVNNEALFRLRRKIPVTHSKIQWERELTPGAFMA